jgi:hypothetical protein
MAKKNTGKGAGQRATDDMSKSELRAYHKEICEFYEENGWRTTLSHFLLSPAQAGEITQKTRDRMEKEKQKAKDAKAKARSKKGTKTASTKRKKAPPKADANRKPSSKKSPNPTSKEATPKKKAHARKTTRRKAAEKINGEALEPTLDYLLAYRAKKGEAVTLDTVIADLTTEVRAA